MRNKNHNKRINHNNGLKIAIMLAMTSGIYGVNGGGIGNSSCRSSSPASSCEIENQGIPLNTSIQATPPTTPRALAESVYGNLAEFDRDVRGRLDNPGDGLDNPGDGRNTQPPQSTPQPRPEIWVTHPAKRQGLLPPLNNQLNDGNRSPNSQDGRGSSLSANVDLLGRIANEWRNSSYQGPALGSGGGVGGDLHVKTPPRSPRPVVSDTSTEAREDQYRGDPAGRGASSNQDPNVPAGDDTSDAGAGGADDAEVRAASSTPRSPSPVGAIVDLPAGGDKATVPEPVKTPLQTPRGLQGTPSTPSYPRVAPEERGIGSEGDDDTESTVSDLDLDFDPNALLLEAKERLAGLGICEYAPAYEGIPILDRLMEIILKGDFQKEYQECLPEDKMTPEQLVAKIVVSYNSINSVYRTRELEDKAFDVDYIIEVGSTNAINLHHTKHLHNGEQYLTSIIGMLHELNAPISQYINAELPALEEIVDNAVKITKRENLRGIKDQLTILQGSLKDAKQSRKNNLKALKELNNVLKGLKSTMDKFTAKTPHQSDEALKNFKLMQDYLDKINNLIEEGKQKDAAIEKITAEINEVETQIASLQGEIDGLEDTCTEVIKQTKLYEGEMRVIYAGIQDLIEQHKADLVLAQEVYGSKSSVE